MTNQQAEERAREAVTEVMVKAFKTYQYTFCVDPHGTVEQTKALLELGVYRAIASALLDTDKRARESERERILEKLDSMKRFHELDSFCARLRGEKEGG